MKRKSREIALLLVPVAALVALVPGARFINNWRVARAVPRVNACITRPATAWEASQGATVGYTANTVVRDTGGPFWSGGIEIRNVRGDHWASDSSNWNSVAVASDDNYPDDGVASADVGSADNTSGETMELRGGLNWPRIAASGASVRAQVSVWPDDQAPQRHVEATRDFTLRSIAPPPLLALRRANFHLEKVRLTTSDYGKESGLNHQFSFVIRRSRPLQRQSPDFVSFDLWQLWKLRFNAANRNSAANFVAEDDAPQPQGLTAVVMQFGENTPLPRVKSARLTGPLFINDGWPQQIRVELPHGLPAQIGTVDLPFTATLAPLPTG